MERSAEAEPTEGTTGPGSTGIGSRLMLPLGLVAVVAVIAAVVFALLWQGARSELNTAREQIDDLEAAESARLEEANARPDVGAAVEKWLGADDAATVTGDSEAASVRIRYPDQGTSEALDRLLDELGFSSAVQDRMGRTRALDGTQQAEGNNVNVTWTYHPDDGLQLVFEVEQ